MTIINTETILHPSPAKDSQNIATQADIVRPKEVLYQVLEQHGKLDQANLSWLDDDTIELSNISGPVLHSFVLRMEELGRDVSFDKKTIINIS